ncbi:MAG: HutD/Ves family protein [Bdellovibrionota bacterium]
MSSRQAKAILIPGSTFKRAAWKNGGGITSEIAIYPPEAKLEQGDFLWRFSSAEVTLPGPFSLFAGFERLITVIAGREIVMRSQEQMVALSAGEVFRFSGQEIFQAELTHGPVTDLGLIFRPDAFRAEMKLLAFQKRPRSFQLAPATNFFFVVDGEFSAEIYPGDLSIPMAKGEVLRMDPLEPVDRSERLILLQPNTPKGTIVAVEIISLEAKNESAS